MKNSPNLQSIVYGNAMDILAEYLERNEHSKLFILVDENTREHCMPSLIAGLEALAHAEVLEVECGEESKTVEIALQLWKVLAELEADRHALIINFGGGMVTDLGGFVASTYKRGIDFIHIPTTLLAQVDACLGGKTGVDMDHLKNLVGTFVLPVLTIIDVEFLKTLPRRELYCGLAEVLKTALVCSETLWRKIQATEFNSLEEFMDFVEPTASLKLELVEKDFRETGKRKALNFGHTVGHALETFSMESGIMVLRHGEAVAIGMVCEAWLSHQQGWITEKDLQQISSFILARFPVFAMDEVHFQRVVEIMRNDKKNRDGLFMLSLLKGIGQSRVNVPINAQEIIRSLKYYRAIAI